MGSGIAAHLANLGLEVTLLDVSRDSVTAGFERSKAAKPPHYFLPETSQKIRLGSTEENLEWVSEADWICEAIAEKLELKQNLFREIEKIIRDDAMISTNTSGLQIQLLAEGRSKEFQSKFMGTHFFNPPRYLKLLELIPTETTDPHAISAISQFLEKRCARRVVLAKDTPGFIANRFGMWSMFHAIHTAEKLHLSIEQVDAVTGPFIGRPKSASFRLNDIVGLDVMADIASNLLERCQHDVQRTTLEMPKSMKHLMGLGWYGEKSGQGYYRREGKEFLALDLTTFAYRQRREVEFESLQSLGRLPLGDRLRSALDLKDEAGEFLRNHLIPVLKYADSVKEEISHSVEDFDRVMRWGFGWQMGPFEMIDAIGAPRLGLGKKSFYQPGGTIGFKGELVPVHSEPQFRELQDFPITSKHEHFLVRDMGDQVSAICTTTKQGTINPGLVDELHRYLSESKHQKFVLASESKNFSLGFDLNFFLNAIQAVDVNAIEKALESLHHLGEVLENKVVVAAVSGYCLGAGLELALSCSKIVASAESQIGLPEAKVGLIPGGRGTVLMRLYNDQDAKQLADTAVMLAEGIVGTNADHARQLGFLRTHDETLYHPDMLYSRAKALALTLAPVSRPQWKKMEGPLVGMIDRAWIRQRRLVGSPTMTRLSEPRSSLCLPSPPLTRMPCTESESSSRSSVSVRSRRPGSSICSITADHCATEGV